MAQRKIIFEWFRESMDDYGEIIEVHTADRLADLPEVEGNHATALVRSVWGDPPEYMDLEDREYFYLDDIDHALETMPSGESIPARHYNQVVRFLDAKATN